VHSGRDTKRQGVTCVCFMHVRTIWLGEEKRMGALVKGAMDRDVVAHGRLVVWTGKEGLSRCVL
jgi:hypothetical protein